MNFWIGSKKALRAMRPVATATGESIEDAMSNLRPAPSIQDRDTRDLLYDLKQQYPSGVTTWSLCQPPCKGAARGMFCSTCIAVELERRGAKPGSVGTLCGLLMDRVRLDAKVDKSRQAILDEIGGDK